MLNLGGGPTTPRKCHSSRPRLAYAHDESSACSVGGCPLLAEEGSLLCGVHDSGRFHEPMSGHIAFAPIRATTGAARHLPTPFPADFELMKQWLSSQRWSPDDLTDQSPQLDELGCIDVRKVYYVLGQEQRRSFNDPATFAEFLGYLQRADHGSARLLLWDATTSAPPTPETQGSMRAVVPA
jgi:hypothetical protein